MGADKTATREGKGGVHWERVAAGHFEVNFNSCQNSTKQVIFFALLIYRSHIKKITLYYTKIFF